MKLYFDFLYKFYLKHSDFKENSARYDHKCARVFMYDMRYSCRIVMQLAFSRQIFEE